LEQTLWFPGPTFNLLSFDGPNIYIAGDGKLLELFQVLLSSLEGQSGCLDVGD
jgi:hypothetical protein